MAYQNLAPSGPTTLHHTTNNAVASVYDYDFLGETGTCMPHSLTAINVNYPPVRKIRF